MPLNTAIRPIDRARANQLVLGVLDNDPIAVEDVFGTAANDPTGVGVNALILALGTVAGETVIAISEGNIVLARKIVERAAMVALDSNNNTHSGDENS